MQNFYVTIYSTISLSCMIFIIMSYNTTGTNICVTSTSQNGNVNVINQSTDLTQKIESLEFKLKQQDDLIKELKVIIQTNNLIMGKISGATLCVADSTDPKVVNWITSYIKDTLFSAVKFAERHDIQEIEKDNAVGTIIVKYLTHKTDVEVPTTISDVHKWWMPYV